MNLRLPRLWLAMTGRMLFAPTVALLLFILWFTSPVYAVTAQITDISNRQYYDATLREINSATQSIDVAMYAMYIRSDEPRSLARELVQALINAHDRGVEVTVYLDHTPGNGKSNEVAYKLLSDAGVRVYFIEKKLKVHTKVIVIDEKTVIEGSSNWTDKAINDNWESNVVIYSPEFAQTTLATFDILENNIDTGARAQVQELVEKVKVANAFLTDADKAADMFKHNEDYAFDLYLWLLKEAKGKEWLKIDYKVVARYLGMRIESEHSKYRFDLRRIIEKLKTQYGLLDYRLGQGNALEIKMNLLAGGYLNIPKAYWVYGLDKQLNLQAKLAYLVAIRQGELSVPKKYWWQGLESLAKNYHVATQAFLHGFATLEKLDLISVRRSEFVAGKGYAARHANQYCLKALVSPKEKARQWRALEKRIGKNELQQARALAGEWDKENNVAIVADFARIIKEYGLERVKDGMKEMAAMQANDARRKIAYLVGVIRAKEQESRR